MNHIDDMQLIEYVAGGLSSSAAKSVGDHIAKCPDCASRSNEMIETWNVMGDWDIDYADNVKSANVPLKIITQAHRRRKIGGTYYIRTKLVPAAVRYAASILIAIGVGAMLGGQGAGSGDSDIASMDMQPEYLAAFNMQWSSDLTWSIISDDAHSHAEEN